MIKELNKFIITVKTHLTKHLSYRFDFFLTLVAPSFIFLFIKYSLWNSIFSNADNTLVSGYTFNEMINYQLWTTLVYFLTRGHNSFDLSNDIRHGKISTYLIYPISFFKFHFAGFFAYALIQTVVMLFSLMVFNVLGFITIPPIQNLIGVMAFCYMISIFWFLVQFQIGLLTFWLEETWVLRVIIGIISGFLNGSVLPLDLYPQAMQTFLKLTPFYYLSHYPTRMLMGKETFDPVSILIFVSWSILIGISINYTWKKGIKEYTAAGI
jgi:ABC-2 type transport system permease protein